MIKCCLVLLYGMGEILGQITFAVAVLIRTWTEVIVAVIANMLAFHAHMLTFHHLPTFFTPEISIIIVAISYLLITFIAIMFGCVLVSAIDNSVAKIAIIVFVFIYVIAN